MQCMVNAMTAVAGATGARSWLGSRHFSWLTPKRLRVVTVVLLGSALLASALVASGTGPPTPSQSQPRPANSATR